MIREIKRKVFHFFSLIYALGFYFLGREAILKVLIPVLVIEGAIEAARLYSPKLNEKLLALFGGIHREEETRRFSGIFWTLLGSALTIWFFRDPRIVLCAMGFLIFADAAAALVGVPLGKHKFRGKSLEGSIACFAAGFVVSLFFMPLPHAILAALIVTAIEFIPFPWNDNFWIPILSGFMLSVGGMIH